MMQKNISILAVKPGTDLLAFIKAASFASGLLSFLAFGALLFSSTSAYLLSGELTMQKKRVQLGIGPFVAGSSSLISDVVWWSELSSENVCDKSSDIYLKWSRPHGLCSDDGKFSLPVPVLALQVVSSIATVFSCLACMVSFSSYQILAAKLVAFCSFVAMVFACTHFAIWTTYPLSVKLQDVGGDVIPLWDTVSKRVVPSEAVQMRFGISFAWFVISFILLFFSASISFSVARLPSRFFEEDDDGSYGLGKL